MGDHTRKTAGPGRVTLPHHPAIPATPMAANGRPVAIPEGGAHA